MNEANILTENEALDPDHRAGFVAVVGRPNVGKSTLMNAYLGQKIAAVSPRPQTTRVRQLGIVTTEAYQAIFLDTPGILTDPRHPLDRFMVESAAETLADADIVLWLVDASIPPHRDDAAIAAQIRQLGVAGNVVMGMNKSDLLTPEKVTPHTEAYAALLPEAEWVLFSALRGEGRDALLTKLIDRLPLGPRYYPEDQITETLLRDIAAELIREQIMLQLREEIPYGTAVTVTEFKERENGLIYINATIHVERDSHKKIIIGRKGAQLQQIGSAARKEITALVESKVYLDLWVKVEPKWRHNLQALKRFGYSRGS